MLTSRWCTLTSTGLPVLKPFTARVVGARVPRVGARWRGGLMLDALGHKLYLLIPGSIARWFHPGEEVQVELLEEPEAAGRVGIAPRDTYRLWRLWEGEKVLVWPPWSMRESLVKESILGDRVYEYRVLAREAVSEADYRSIVELEQYHYASKEEIVAIWRCPQCGYYMESNIQPRCPKDGTPMKLQEIRGSLPSSRFLIVELESRMEYEPRVVAYVRVDTPIPLMHRRVPSGDGFKVERMIREKVFPPDWFHPTFWPLSGEQRKLILTRFRELAKLYGSRRVARAVVGEEIAREALRRANTAAARIARVVVHPDYRGDGLGVLAAKMALHWIRDRRIPEMKRRKHIVETIAQMARYNPFFERVGFKFVWETASGRPVLMYPLTDEARNMLERFLAEDEYAKLHGGRLYRSRYGRVDPLPAPVRLRGVSKVYRSMLDLSSMPEDLQEVLRAFGAERRVVERVILRGVDLEIRPGEVVAVLGASGAGKTTLLRIIIGSLLGLEDDAYKPSEGTVAAPNGARVEYLLPGEHEPLFGGETLLEHLASRLGDPATAVEVLNMVGLSDAIFYRARFSELSTGQKERAKLASMLASRPSLLVIDEFTAHLDTITARRVARKVGALARRAGITLIVSTNRPEVLRSLAPDKVLIVGYGSVSVKQWGG